MDYKNYSWNDIQDWILTHVESDEEKKRLMISFQEDFEEAIKYESLKMASLIINVFEKGKLENQEECEVLKNFMNDFFIINKEGNKQVTFLKLTYNYFNRLISDFENNHKN